MFGAAAPFAIRAINASWPMLVERVKPDLLPTQTPPEGGRKRKPSFKEYGCGHYGCVFPTGKPGVVLKVTSDPSEVQFVQAAMQIGEWPDGIVRYYDLFQAPGSYRGRPVVFLWREEAQNVGVNHWIAWQAVAEDNYKLRMRQQFERRLSRFKDLAHDVRAMMMHSRSPEALQANAALLAAAKKLEDWAWNYVGLDDVEGKQSGWTRAGSARLQALRGPHKIAAYLRALEIIIEQMENEPEGYLVGQALGFYLERGILLADVHGNNIGEVVRDDYKKPILAIVDPGHAVFLPR